MEDNHNLKNQSGKVLAGLIIVAIGSLFLLDNFGLDLPNWIFYWSNILIVIGLFIGFKHNFRNGRGVILIIIGSFFTLKKGVENFYDFDKVGWPLLIIGLGLFLIFKPKNDFSNGRFGGRRNRWKFKFGQDDQIPPNPASDPNLNPDLEKKTSNQDYLDSVNVFGGSHHVVYSKKFMGGEITAVFGGCDVNLTQADFEGEVVIDITAIFGGAKIIVPAGWSIKNEVTAVFGSFEDKRIAQVPSVSNKLLIIKGIALFGGVDVRSY